MGNGACFSIWIKDVPDAIRMKLLREYSDMVVKRIKGCFHLDFGVPKINWFERIQIKRAIGYVPKFEITICGGLDCIFLATEAILREFEGCVTFGIPKEELERKNIKGKIHHYYTISFQFNRPEINKCYLTNVDIFSAYYNSMEDEETKKLYTFPELYWINTKYFIKLFQ